MTHKLTKGTHVQTEVWQEAISFAARKHDHQYRKDDSTPYFSHPVRVAFVVSQVFGCDDEQAICAAILHDVIEDTGTDYDEIKEHFDTAVADIVACLTKDARLPEHQREDQYYRKITEGPWQAKLVKLADAYDNICDSIDKQMRTSAAAKARRAIESAGQDPQLAVGIERLTALLDRPGI